MLINEDNTLK